MTECYRLVTKDLLLNKSSNSSSAPAEESMDDPLEQQIRQVVHSVLDVTRTGSGGRGGVRELTRADLPAVVARVYDRQKQSRYPEGGQHLSDDITLVSVIAAWLAAAGRRDSTAAWAMLEEYVDRYKTGIVVCSVLSAAISCTMTFVICCIFCFYSTVSSTRRLAHGNTDSSSRYRQ